MSTVTLLVEIGTEELPPTSLRKLGLAFRDGIGTGLQRRELAHGKVDWFATPRRLAVMAREVLEQAPPRRVEVLGPPADRARSEDGSWSPAASGFARKQGMAADDLEIIDSPKGPRLGVVREEAGVAIHEAFNSLILEAIDQLPIARRMRWGAGRDEFVRPVQWVLAMLDEVHDFGSILGVKTGNLTFGHRVHSPDAIEIRHPDDYLSALGKANVVAQFDLRRERIREQVAAEAARAGAHAVIDPQLLEEVTGLVEWPVALTGSFDRRFLAVPQEALVSAMKAHQKYFHLTDADGRLQPCFITVSNLESRDPQQVIAGNERVIRPRLADAAFFYEQDLATELEAHVPELGRVVFEERLGSLLDKTHRVSGLAVQLAETLAVDTEACARAAWLSKADLLTQLVQEFPDLQGIAGAHYAQRQGETDAVARALEQQYRPRFSGDLLPEDPVATCLALADRLDTLVGIFGIGQPPTGSRDPFALRRASLAVLRIIVDKALALDLRYWLDRAVAQYQAGTLQDSTATTVLDYMLDRFRAWYEEEQIAPEVFRAVSALGITQPLDIQRRVHAVHHFSRLPEAGALSAANKRVSNILGKLDAAHEFADVDVSRFSQHEEHRLWEAMQEITERSSSLLARGAYTESLASLASLRDPVDRFFDSVMVNAEDPGLRSNRLNLLKTLRDQFSRVADLSQLAGTGS